MMLDTKRTFDDLVARHAPSPEARNRILTNRLYEHLSAHLAGTQEYMAMEKLLALEQDPNFDLIILDTPPTSNALDFLDAPDRLVRTLDSPAIRWFVEAFSESRRLRFSVMARGAALALRGISRLVGSGFSEQLAEFITELDQLFGGFRERARAVAQAFRSDGFAYVLVTSPAPDAIREISFFAERLASLGLRRDALVVNRVHAHPGAPPSGEELHQALVDGAPGLVAQPPGPGTRLVERIAEAFRDEVEWATVDRAHLGLLDRSTLARSAEPHMTRIHVPALPGDVHDLRTLATIGHVLCPLERADSAIAECNVSR